MKICNKGVSNVFLLLFCFFICSCLSSNGRRPINMNFPIGIRAMKKKIHPPQDFIAAMFAFKKEKGYWPVSERDFESSVSNNRRIFQDFYNTGFLSYQLGYQTLDSLEIHFVHKPVYNQTLGLFVFKGRDVKLKTLLVASGHLHTTNLEK